MAKRALRKSSCPGREVRRGPATDLADDVREMSADLQQRKLIRVRVMIPAAIRPAGGADLSLPAALSVLLESDAGPRRRGAERRRMAARDSLKPPSSVCYRLDFPVANHSLGATWLKSFAAHARPNFTPTSSPAVSVWMKPRRASCGHAGLDSVQLSFQSDEPDLADEIAGARAHHRKLEAAAANSRRRNFAQP